MNILFMPQTGALGPSSRYRVYQLLPSLRAQGIHCEVAPGIGDELYRRIYLGEDGGGSRRAALAAIWRQRRADLGRVGDFDAVFVQKGFFPGLYSGLERGLAARRPMVFDFDDAIWLPRQGGSKLLRALHRETAVQDILRGAAQVIAGNNFLAEYAARFNRCVTVVPSAIDVARYPRGVDAPLPGWIGSRTTLPYLAPLRPVFEALRVRPRVIASGDPAALGIAVDFRPWQLDSELTELAQIGIGLAPLPDTPWERGKCGVKLLQYMACGIPVVASPVGVHNQIVRHGVNGFLAGNAAEWETCLRELMESSELRRELGAAGRATVEKAYDLPVAAAAVASVLRAAQKPANTQTSGITGKL